MVGIRGRLSTFTESAWAAEVMASRCGYADEDLSSGGRFVLCGAQRTVPGSMMPETMGIGIALHPAPWAGVIFARGAVVGQSLRRVIG